METNTYRNAGESTDVHDERLMRKTKQTKGFELGHAHVNRKQQQI